MVKYRCRICDVRYEIIGREITNEVDLLDAHLEAIHTDYCATCESQDFELEEDNMSDLYEHRPSVVHAMLYTGDNAPLIWEFCGGENGCFVKDSKGAYIRGQKGQMAEVEIGDYVVRGVDQIYPVKPDVFKLLYNKII